MEAKKIEELIKFHAIVEAEAIKIGWGMITFNVFLKDGMPLNETLNVVRQRRRKYQLTTERLLDKKLIRFV